jgi:hypothetical protein
MPWHVATLKGRNKYRGGEEARRRKRRVINKEKKSWKDEILRVSKNFTMPFYHCSILYPVHGSLLTAH